MILSTHAVVGASVAIALRSNPTVALIAAFLSHYALDAIPHWEYRLLSREKDSLSPFGEKLNFNRNFLKDVFRTGVDFGIGLAVSLAVSQYFFPDYLWLGVLGALAGALPDALQVAYYCLPDFKPLYYFQRFHEKAHAEKRLDNEPIKGISWEVIVSIAFIVVIIFLD